MGFFGSRSYTFDDAIEFKRNGEYETAITVYEKLINKALETKTRDSINAATKYAYAEAKVWYLLEDYNKSLENYAYSLKLICLINKLFAMDYVRIFHENLQDRNTRSAFIMSARDHIRHLGHVVGDKDTLSADPSLVYKYVVSLAGGENKRTKQFKEKYNFEYAAEDSVYALYEEMCWKVGVDVFCNIMDRIIIELHPDLAQRLNVQR